MDLRSLRDKRGVELIRALVSISFVYAAEVVGFLVTIFLDVSDESLWSVIIPEAFGALAAVACVVRLGDRSLAEPSREDAGFTFRFGWWCLAISIGICAYAFYTYQVLDTPVSSDWLPRLFECALYCLCIGILEEFMFRGLIFNGLLSRMGGNHKGVVAAVFITSAVFGAAHIDFQTDFVDLLAAVQAILKIVQTGMYSILLCVIMLRTRRLVGVSLFHGFDDFLIIAPGIAFYNEPAEVEYVSTGEDAIPTIIYYLFVIGLYTPFVIKSLRELRRGNDVCRGAFIRDEWQQQASTAVQPLSCRASASSSNPLPAGQAAPPPPSVRAPLPERPTLPANPPSTIQVVPPPTEGSHEAPAPVFQKYQAGTFTASEDRKQGTL